MQNSAKHDFAVVWAHMGACRAVGSRFPVIFGAFPWFWEPRPAPAGPEPPSRPRIHWFLLHPLEDSSHFITNLMRLHGLLLKMKKGSGAFY